jgi:haloalkane dehalogenase
MDVLRTPEDRFDDLPDFPYVARHVEVPAGDPEEPGQQLRLAYLDEGPADGEVVLLLHGEPSWSYLYRHMIPVLVAAGHRCVAPDLIGFGRSDKPASRHEHTYARHVGWLRAALFEGLDLRQVTLVCQDWGGLLGLRLVGEHPERFARVVAANTSLPTGHSDLGDAFRAWQQYSQDVDVLPVGRIVAGGCTSELAPEVVAAYDAPFPDETYKEGPRQLPTLVPGELDAPAARANQAAWAVLERFERPFLTAFSDQDPITAGAEVRLRERIPGAAGMAHTTIVGAGHFLQEDRGPELARVVSDLMAATPPR